jgi:lipopolysaccharide export system protein LptC
MITRWGPLLLLVVLALGIGSLLGEIELQPESDETLAQHRPDFRITDFVSTNMGESGNPRRRLQADYMEHFPDTDTSELVSPYLIMYHAGAQPWHIRSERGWSSADGEVLLLLGKVHIWRDDASGKLDIDIRTRDLRVVTQTEYGETDEPVVIRTRTTESHGVGMHARLAQDRLDLLANVRTLYRQNGLSQTSAAPQASATGTGD